MQDKHPCNAFFWEIHVI